MKPATLYTILSLPWVLLLLIPLCIAANQVSWYERLAYVLTACFATWLVIKQTVKYDAKLINSTS